MILSKKKCFHYMSTPMRFSNPPQFLKINKKSARSQMTILGTGKCGLGTDPLGKRKLRRVTV